MSNRYKNLIHLIQSCSNLLIKVKKMKIKIRVPSTTANLGPGFDVFGAALSLYNEFESEYVPNARKTSFILDGEGEKLLPKGEENLVWQSMLETFKVLEEDKYNLKNLNIRIKTGIPLNGGLGSSASAIVGGIALANVLCGKELDKSQIADLAVKIEGHPDNVAPAVFGGLCACSKDGDGDHGIVLHLPIPKLKVVLCIPSFELRTKHARQILPESIGLKDVVFNISRVAMLTAAFCRGDYSLLKQGMQDKVHQLYRGKMIPAMDEVFEAAISAGAYGAFLSGSGPALAAFCKEEDGLNVQKAMVKRWEKENISIKSHILDFDTKGVLEV
ncbi:homoserine kinase [Endomicrobiia bacterium]|nr:homoserine kinase [Endomicrobiia bacterium]GHT12060.1 homoserine kinase [Endomicrobiia bacterium]GHT26035.1 homoserine kinase [Endomicrobiia bacterium]